MIQIQFKRRHNDFKNNIFYSNIFFYKEDCYIFYDKKYFKENRKFIRNKNPKSHLVYRKNTLGQHFIQKYPLFCIFSIITYKRTSGDMFHQKKF